MHEYVALKFYHALIHLFEVTCACAHDGQENKHCICFQDNLKFTHAHMQFVDRSKFVRIHMEFVYVSEFVEVSDGRL